MHPHPTPFKSQCAEPPDHHITRFTRSPHHFKTNTHFVRSLFGSSFCRPYVFSNIFQSAPVVAAYVANALEAGTSWQRVERFFLSATEADPALAGIRVAVKGRLGEPGVQELQGDGRLTPHDLKEVAGHTHAPPPY